MRRWIAVAVVGGLVFAGCAPDTAIRQTTSDSTSSTVIAENRSVSGSVTFENAWTFDPGDFPRTVHNGEPCQPTGEGRADGDLELQLVVEDGTGDVIGEADLRVGEISGLGLAGFELPSQLETVLIATESLMRRATCASTFSIDLSSTPPAYSFVVDGQPGAVYSKEDLDTLNWVVELEQG